MDLKITTADRVKAVITAFMKEQGVSGPKTNPLLLQDRDRLIDDLLLKSNELPALGQEIFAAFATEFSNPIDFRLDFGLDNPNNATVGGVIAYVLGQTN